MRRLAGAVVMVGVVITGFAGRLDGQVTLRQIGGTNAVESENDQGPRCVDCHDTVRARVNGQAAHGAVEIGCEGCHFNHREWALGFRTAERTAPYYLRVTGPDLCWSCHDETDPSYSTAHGDLPFQRSDCTRCHDPHGSGGAHLLPKYQHGPFESRSCQACHEAGATVDNNLGISAKNARELCFGCHEAMKQRVETAPFVHYLVRTDEDACMDCHDPHGTDYERFVKMPVRQLCARCHVDVIGNKRYVHQPAEASCTICHDPHSSDNDKHLYLSVNETCLQCHGRRGIFVTQGAGDVVLGGGMVKLPHRPFGRVPWFSLNDDETKGHPMLGHPVYQDEGPGKKRIRCTTCHRPHSADGSPDLLVTESPDKSQLCAQCH